jgi:hypothetical protein
VKFAPPRPWRHQPIASAILIAVGAVYLAFALWQPWANALLIALGLVVALAVTYRNAR